MVLCFVPTCNHISRRENCSFFRFPSDVKQLELWIKAIGREDCAPSSNSRICSCHFVNGKKNNLPTLFELHQYNSDLSRAHRIMNMCDIPPKKSKIDNILIQRTPLSSVTNVMPRRVNRIMEMCLTPSSSPSPLSYYLSPNRPSDTQPQTNKALINSTPRLQNNNKEDIPPRTNLFLEKNIISPLNQETSKEKASRSPSILPLPPEISEPIPPIVPSPSSNSDSATNNKKVIQNVPLRSDPILEAEMYFLKKENEELRQKLGKKSQFGLFDIKHNDKLVTFYTGFPNYELLQIFLDLFDEVEVNYYKFKVEKISRQDQIFMTLMKLRINSCQIDLARQFNCCQATVSNIIITWIHVLHEVLVENFMKEIPSTAKNKVCLPSCFSNFMNCRIVLDCTEVHVQAPKSLLKQKKVYSHYKHMTTFKGLIGVAPNGVATFCSKLYPGSTSDKEIVRHCGVLKKLQPGDLILADKGFLISDILPAGVSVNIPPFLMTLQFNSFEVERGKLIARARIHVERAISRVKYFRILTAIPQDYFFYSSKIWQLCVALTNFRFPLIKELEDVYDQLTEDLS